MKSAHETNLYSKELTDVLKHLPHWLVRFGSTIFFVMVIILLAGSYFIKYPSIIKSNILFSESTVHSLRLANTKLFDGNIKGLISIPAIRIEEIRLGSKIVIFFKNKPVIGKVTKIPPLSMDKNSLVEVTFDSSSIRNVTLPQVESPIEVLIEEKRIIEYFFSR